MLNRAVDTSVLIRKLARSLGVFVLCAGVLLSACTPVGRTYPRRDGARRPAGTGRHDPRLLSHQRRPGARI